MQALPLPGGARRRLCWRDNFRLDFSDLGIDYIVEKQTRTDLYENLEVALNAGQVELLDLAKLRRELMTIVQRGASLDHMPGQNDDWATSAAGALTLVNPDIGNTTPNMLLFYQRQAEANVASAAPPTLQSEHAGAAVMQIGTRRPADFVKIAVAGEPSHIFGISGVSYLVEVEDGQRIVWMSLDDAKAQVGSSLNLPFFEVNTALRERLGAKPTPSRGIRWSDLVQAAEDAQPVDPTDLGRITN